MSENQKNNQLTIIDAEGNEVLCEILFTYHSDEFNKDYVIFYPVEALNSEDEQLELMAASFVEGEDGGELSEITTDEEWQMIEDVLAEYEESLEQHAHGCCCHNHDGGCEKEECECDHDGCEKEDCECDHDGCKKEDEEEHHCCCRHHHE